jgi:phosphomannomutase
VQVWKINPHFHDSDYVVLEIINPHDEGISDSIKANLKPQTWATEALELSPLCFDRTEDMRDAYFSELATMTLSRLVWFLWMRFHWLKVRSRSLNASTPIKFVNTSLHGVGDCFVRKAFETFGFAPFIPVKEQQIPDPEFPTVKFPNPEEKGMLLMY